MWWLRPHCWCQDPSQVPGYCTNWTQLWPQAQYQKRTLPFALTQLMDPHLSLKEKQNFEILHKVMPKPHSFACFWDCPLPAYHLRFIFTSFSFYNFICLWHVCTWVGDGHAQGPIKELDFLLYHASPHSLEKGSPVKPGARQMVSKPPGFLLSPPSIALWSQSWVNMPRALM